METQNTPAQPAGAGAAAGAAQPAGAHHSHRIKAAEEDCRLPGARSEKHSAGQLQRKTMGEKCSKLHCEAFQWNECNAEIKIPY